MTATGSPSVSYGYDTAGRLASITQGAETFGYTYDTLSRITRMTRPNGVDTTYVYDPLNRLTRMTHSAIEDFQYAYTPDNLIAGISSVNSTAPLPTAKTANVPNQMNQISQFGNAGYSFDDKGQTTTKTDAAGATTYNWDSRGRMTSASLPNGQTINYSYDALGRRNSRTANGSTTNFIYDGADVIQDKQGGDQTNYLNGGIDDKLRISSAQTGNLYFLKDHLGSTQGLTGVSGSVAEWQRYTPFGESDVSASMTRYGYTGREKDADSGLMYYRARWYDAQQGRFISQDPIGLAGGNTNLYSYVSNDPINKTDPSGLYNIDVHYYLTYFIASKFPCLTPAEARLIADADQSTDENDDTSPGAGVTARQRQANSDYHAFNQGNTGNQQNLWNNALKGPTNYVGLGRYLHYLQDKFSHRGFYNSAYGQLTGGFAVDDTNNDVGKAAQMASSTWFAIRDWIKAKKCKCGDQSDTGVDKWWPQVMEFLRTANDQLERKRQILGVPPR